MPHAAARRALSRARGLLALLLLAACQTEVPPERLPRYAAYSEPPRVALVLGSGGPRGFAHVGVLKVLDEAGIRPDLVVGASVGALVGAFYSAGIPMAQLERLAIELDVERFFLEWRVVRGRPASGEAIQSYVNEALDARTIEQLPVRFAAAATRVSDRRLAVFNEGDIGLAVRASSAVPRQFEPAKVGGELYVDGDEASPVPILAARALGARVVIAVDVSAHRSTTPPGVPAEWVAKDERRAAQVKREAPAADVLLHPDIGYYAGHSEAYRRRVIAIAERYTRERLPEILAAVARAQNEATKRSPAGEASR